MDGQRSEHVGKLSWRMTALNRCTVTESYYYFQVYQSEPRRMSLGQSVFVS